jgi:gluconokinase
MGFSGCGKTTIGKLLSDRLGWVFIESDEYHSPDSIRKMSNGVPLTDEDREPWLECLHDLLVEHLRHGLPLIMACSALKEKYRQTLREGLEGIILIYLKGDFKLIQERILDRREHFMKANMLQSQFDTLEEPADAWVMDISQTPIEIVREILHKLRITQ